MSFEESQIKNIYWEYVVEESQIKNKAKVPFTRICICVRRV